MTTKVTPLTSKDLEGLPGKEGALFLIEYPPGARPIRFTATTRRSLSTFWKGAS